MASDDDPFADRPGARLSQASQNDYFFAWRRLLGFFAIHEPAALEEAPDERLTPERVRAFRAHLAESNTPRSVAGAVAAVYYAARLMMPERDWTWLKTIKRRLYRGAPSSAPAAPIATSLQLLELGEQLMEENTPEPGSPFSKKQAMGFRDGLLFALASFRPLRRKNLVALDIGRQLVPVGDKWFIIIPREETKTRRTPIEFQIPDLLQQYLEIYLDVVRPQLLSNPNCKALWLNSQGRPLAYAQIGGIISRHSMRRLNIRITPHKFRHAAVTTLAIFKPDQIRVARDLLAHADLKTMDDHYNWAPGIEASRAYGQLIAQMRRKQKRRSR